MHMIARDTKQSYENYCTYRDYLFKVKNLESLAQEGECAFRVYLTEPYRKTRVITMNGDRGHADIEIRRADVEADILWANLGNGSMDSQDAVGLKIYLTKYRTRLSVCQLIERTNIADTKNAWEVENRPIVLDGSAYRFIIIREGNVHIFDFTNPTRGYSKHDNRVVNFLSELKALLGARYD